MAFSLASLDAPADHEVTFELPLMPIICTDREIAPPVNFTQPSSPISETSDGHWTFVSGLSGVPLR